MLEAPLVSQLFGYQSVPARVDRGPFGYQYHGRIVGYGSSKFWSKQQAKKGPLKNTHPVDQTLCPGLPSNRYPILDHAELVPDTNLRKVAAYGKPRSHCNPPGGLGLSKLGCVIARHACRHGFGHRT